MSNTVKSREPIDGQLSFRFVSGHRALDFAATFGDRYRSGFERLRQPADLDRWLGSAGISAGTPASAHDLDDARELREVIYRLARAALHNEAISGADLDALNAWARTPPLAPQLDRRLRHEWASTTGRPSPPPIARSASGLAVDEPDGRILPCRDSW